MPSPIPTEDAAQKKERVRRNLRIIALCVAGYYFISAGFTWYSDHQAEKLRLVPQVENVFASEGDFSKVLDAASNGSADLAAGVDAGRISLEMKNGEVNKAVFQAKFEDGLNVVEKTRARAFLMACENTTDDKTIGKLMDILCMNETDPAKLKSGLQAASRRVSYKLTAAGSSFKVEASRIK
ncbi:MAG: hypothetical protein ACI4NA_05755 [Succinivibrio sp.]